MNRRKTNQALYKSLLLLGIIWLSFLVIQPTVLALSGGNQSPNSSSYYVSMDAKLNETLTAYKIGEIDPETNVTVIIEFRDQTHSLLIPDIKSKYKNSIKSHKTEINEILRKYKVNKTVNRLNRTYTKLTIEDEIKISEQAKAIETMETTMKNEIRTKISNEISKKQKPFKAQV